MGLIFGIITAVLTLPVAFVVLMTDSNWETGLGGHPVGAVATLAMGWSIAGALVYSHWHPMHW